MWTRRPVESLVQVRYRTVELYLVESYDVAVSVTIECREFGAGDDAFVEEAWELKEQIRRQEGVLKQRRGFFTDAYRRSTVHALVKPGYDDETLVGFASTRRDGYILFLAVAREYRGEGFGRQLIAAVADEHDSVTCHARTTNDAALSFYKHLGFNIERRVKNYYEDQGNAYYLRLGDGGLASKLSRFVPGA
jgi:ribosomal protein S18 acetylase RimI-like enzyme